MGLLLLREVSDETRIGIWEVEEPAGWFQSQLQLDEQESEMINAIKNEKRKIHWLSSRMLLRALLNNPADAIHLSNDKNGMPVVQNHDVKISISHSEDLSALIISNTINVGIDIEKVDKKIERIHQKFLNEGELKSISAENRLEQLFVYWCAKEAMYKLHGKKQLDFRKHLFVDPFNYADSGEIYGMIQKDQLLCKVVLRYEKVGSYMMAYTITSSETRSSWGIL